MVPYNSRTGECGAAQNSVFVSISYSVHLVEQFLVLAEF